MNLLLAGLGNPGDKYRLNRHNAGFMFLDWLLKAKDSHFIIKEERFRFDKYSNAELLKVEYKSHKSQLTTVFAKPQTFMNRSGQTVAHLISVPTIIFVAHDDLDIRIGNFKIQKSVGPKMHNGLESIEQSLKSKSFWRIRIGIDNRTSDNSTPGEPYVLSNFSGEEAEMLEKTFPRILSKLQLLLEDPSIL